MADESVPSLISSSNQGRLETADLVTFTEEILNAKLHFLCSTRRSHRCKIPPARRYQDLDLWRSRVQTLCAIKFCHSRDNQHTTPPQYNHIIIQNVIPLM